MHESLKRRIHQNLPLLLTISKILHSCNKNLENELSIHNPKNSATRYDVFISKLLGTTYARFRKISFQNKSHKIQAR
jgi:hypothetical protein